MPEKNNRNQQPAARRERVQFDPYWMIRNAETFCKIQQRDVCREWPQEAQKHKLYLL